MPLFIGQSNQELAWALLSLWPSFFAFIGSFATILVLWINHHGLFTLAEHVTPQFLFANGFLLLIVIFLPFPTALLAQRLTGPGANTGAVVYCGTFVLTNISYHLLLSAVASPQSIRKDVSPDLIKRIRTAYIFGSLIYVTATVVAWFNALAGVLICSLLWLLWTRLSYSDKAGQ